MPPLGWQSLATIVLASALVASLIALGVSPAGRSVLAGLLHMRFGQPAPVDVLQAVNLTSAKIAGKKYVVLGTGSSVRVFGLSRLKGRPRIPMPEIDGNRRVDSVEYVGLFTKARDLFSGLQRSGVPCIYAVSFQPIESDTLRSEVGQRRSEMLEVAEQMRNNSASRCDLEEKEFEFRRALVGEKTGFFQAEALILVWADGSSERLDEAEAVVDRRLEIMSASLLAAFPEASLERLEDKALVEFLASFFCLQIPSPPKSS